MPSAARRHWQHAASNDARTRWLVGCDDGRSAVRKLADLAFPGTEPEFTGYHALVDIADPHKLRPGRHATPSGFYMNLLGQIAIADFDRSNAISWLPIWKSDRWP